MKKTKKFIIFGIIILSIIIIAIYYIKPILLKRLDYQYMNSAINRKDPSLCEKIKLQWEKDSCYSETYIDIAISTQDSSVCDKILYQYSKDSCYLDVAVLKQDILICDKIPGNDINSRRYSCYKYIALAKQDSSICDKIQDQIGCIKEIEEVQKGVSFCREKVGTWDNTFCYVRLAIAKNDSSICDYIGPPSAAASCARIIMTKRIHEGVTISEY
jgi:hypothetical protein